MAQRRWPWWTAGAVYAVFLCWHEPWFVPRLSAAEVQAAFDGPLAGAPLNAAERASMQAFFAADDGRPFYNLNLMRHRERALYRDGQPRPGIVTGADAHAAYSAVVLPQLLQRGGYPVAITTKITNLLNERAPGADFFQDMALVRYRSRRDMLEMILDPAYRAGAPHKFASLEQDVATPMRAVALLDLRLPVGMLLAVSSLLVSSRGIRQATDPQA
jgi:hypothetical protein